MFALFRAISVILGDKWKAMKQEDRREYVIQAKLLADEHKRVNPDCWKRKRNSEVSQQILFTYLHNFLIGLFGKLSWRINPQTFKSIYVSHYRTLYISLVLIGRIWSFMKTFSIFDLSELIFSLLPGYWISYMEKFFIEGNLSAKWILT